MIDGTRNLAYNNGGSAAARAEPAAGANGGTHMKHFKWDKVYLYWGVTAFLVIAASILFYLLIRNVTWLGGALGALLRILSPFIWGLVIAYLLYPLLKIYNRSLFLPLCRLLYRNAEDAETKTIRTARGLSVFLCILSLLVLIGGLIWMVVPQIYSSLERVVVNSQDYIDRADAFLTATLADYPELEATVTTAFGDLSNGIVSWATNQLLPQMSGLIGTITSSGVLGSITNNVVSVVKSIYNIVIGIIVSVYVLYSRDSFAAHGKMLLYCIFSLETVEKLLSSLQFMNEVFMGFISGKILDSLIVGVICYIGCMILRIPYPLLVGFIVGLFNIIPFFGPIIGAIPSAIIVLTVSPLKMLILLIFIVVLQQFDGNILGPKILGDRVGINGFWVMFAIILGAGLFGFAGMLLGVPVFVILYAAIRGLVARRLRHNGLPAEAAEYMGIGYFDPATKQPVEWVDQPHSSRKRKKPAWKLPVLPLKGMSLPKKPSDKPAAPEKEPQPAAPDKSSAPKGGKPKGK